ncbi:hypothetical protein [Parabacteroides provencensis]|uniref:hypothetical protein n=1 Tax=Parabacteroides provencensis TaxID=1944636 RepID=UPI0011812A4A|nr:hypothetical protein [Parabacteroides provencensis]
MAEIKMFYDWLETHSLTPASITLWHGLMFIANRSGWKNPLPISLSVIESRTMIPRASIYRERERLREAGLIDFSTKGGKASCLYTIYSLSQQLESHGETQSAVNEDRIQHLESQSEKQNATIIYKLNYTESNKEKSEKEDSEKMEVGADAPPSLSPEEKKERKSCAKKKEKREAPQLDTNAILQTIEPPWRELMHTWLEYKRLRKESYRSEIGIRKCLTMLRNLSGNNLETAAAIIDQSMANNWAGLFELKRQAYTPRGQPLPATGQHIGQIKQPETEEHKNRILEKFGKPKK